MTITPAISHVRTSRWNRPAQPGEVSVVPEETAVALTYDGTTHAVMMATPLDLEDYAVGFSLSEGHVSHPGQIREIEVAHFEEGIDLRIWLVAGAAARFRERRRSISGPTGCGLCGIESLAQANAPPPRVNGSDRYDPDAILAAQASLTAAQALHAETRAMLAAGFWRPGHGLVACREDVGRHNALDKLAGALARRGTTGAGGLLLLTSRVSVEMVQKAAMLGAPVVVAVSAPTALAIRTAETAGITLVARARGGSFEVYTHPERLKLGA